MPYNNVEDGCICGAELELVAEWLHSFLQHCLRILVCATKDKRSEVLVPGPGWGMWLRPHPDFLAAEDRRWGSLAQLLDSKYVPKADGAD